MTAARNPGSGEIDETQLQQTLADAGQDHLWRHRSSLPAEHQGEFTRQLAEIDWPLVRRLIELAQGADGNATSHSAAEGQRAQPPLQLICQPTTLPDGVHWNESRKIGQELMSSGKVAAVVVAGGQGTRLGSPLPKGMVDIGPVSGHSFFQIFVEQVIARSRNAQRPIPYGVMTSDATHEATEEFFRQQGNFGLPADQLRFFRQGNMPAVDGVTGKALISEPGRLALSPDGHGGMLRALVNSGWLDELAQRGVETLFYHQIDNPTTQVCDPAFLGWHAQRQAQASTKVVAKRSAEEKMGVAVSVDGISKIIEYSDLPADIAAKTDDQGKLLLWAGSTAIHAFQISFLQRVASGEHAFPFHIARKAVPYLDDAGTIVAPDGPNAFKFEQFIFDLLPLASQALFVEADRAAEFNPVKNKEGADSPATCQAAMQTLHRRWLREAGANIADDVPVEIGPLFALDAEEVARRITPPANFEQPTFLTA
ncbi:MAG: UTP--glucose-1-phosphate uridylyltransferase [Planctomycetaceae bacterium]